MYIYIYIFVYMYTYIYIFLEETICLGGRKTARKKDANMILKKITKMKFKYKKLKNHIFNSNTNCCYTLNKF